MPETALAETVLAWFAGRDRAAAIYGDLLELSGARGRLWFWIAYFRTVATLGWRTPVAIVAAFASARLMFGIVIPWVGWQFTSHVSDAGFFGEERMRLSFGTFHSSSPNV